MQRINLYTDALRPKREPLRADNAVLVLLGAVLLVLASMVWARLGVTDLQRQVQQFTAENDRRAAEVAGLAAQMAARPGAESVQAALDVSNARIQQKQQLLDRIQALVADDSGFSEPLAALARQSIPQVWLTRVELLPLTQELRLEGQTRQPEWLPVYLERLGSEAAFRGRTFSQFALTRGDDEPRSVSFRVATPVGGAP
ncbi:MAG: hypothetical protein LAT63_16000 [Marinobacter sp.]|nr:hypothetical protein [Marinobacter sp.]